MKNKNGNIQSVRRAVCMMANRLHKAGKSLSEAFKLAWLKVKNGVLSRVAGVTFGKRQASLERLDRTSKSDIAIALQREADNVHDSNAVRVLGFIKSIRKYAVLGYLPSDIAATFAPLMDAGLRISAYLKGITGGYGDKLNRGALIALEI